MGIHNWARAVKVNYSKYMDEILEENSRRDESSLGLAGSFHPSTHPVPRFPLQYSCQVVNLLLTGFVLGALACSMYGQVCLG